MCAHQKMESCGCGRQTLGDEGMWVIGRRGYVGHRVYKRYTGVTWYIQESRNRCFVVSLEYKQIMKGPA